jgi:hypothetical protein
MESLNYEVWDSIKTIMVDGLRGTVWPSSPAEMGPEANSTKQ